MSSAQSDAPVRIWLCLTCRCTSGKAGHIGCTGPDGKPQPTPVEYVLASRALDQKENQAEDR